METAPTPSSTHLRAALEAVLQVLVDATETSASAERVGRAARQVVGEHPLQQLEDACAAVGMRARPLTGRASAVLPSARSDLPIVTWLEQEETWAVFSDFRLGRVRSWRPDDPRGWRWAPLRHVIDEGPREWAFVEPALPACSLAGDEGEGRLQPSARLRRLLRVERQDLGVVVIYAVVAGVLALGTPIAVQLLINFLAFGAFFQPVFVLMIGLLLSLALVALLQALQRWIVEIVQRRIFVRVVSDLSERLLRARTSAFDRSYGPELVNRFFDVFTVEKAVGTLMLDGITAGLQAAAGLLLLALYHPYLIAFDVVILAGIGGILLLGRGAQRTAIEQSRVKYEVAGWLEEVARHPVVFKLGGENLAVDRADRLARAYLRARERHWRIFFRQYVGAQALAVVVNVALLAVCAWLVLQGELTLGQLVAAEFIVAAALTGVIKFSEKLDTIYDLFAGIDKLGTLFDLPQERRGGMWVDPPDHPPSIALQGAAFRYDDESGGVGPIDLEVAPGERLCIVGPPGSGKSTLADLLVGARRPSEGLVLRDGVDTSVLRPVRVHAEAELVRSGGILQASILDNLTLGLDLPEAAVWELLERLDLAAEIRRFPDRLDTELQPSGLPLSEGRARMLLVARAMITQPRLIVVDGLLDAVPGPFRQGLLDALRDPNAPWTLVVMSEDVDAAVGFDRVLYLVDGGLRDALVDPTS